MKPIARISRKLVMSLSVAAVIFSLAGCDRWSGKPTYSVKRVSDGDTIVVVDGNRDLTVRFACMDAPEVPHNKQERYSRKIIDKNQFSWGIKSQNRLQRLLKQAGDRVVLQVTDTDQYGRQVSEVRLANGTLIQQVLIKEGLALVYRPYLKKCPSASEIDQAEADAKKNFRGVWGDPNFTPPWDYRRKSK